MTQWRADFGIIPSQAAVPLRVVAALVAFNIINKLQKKINVQNYVIYVLAERANKLGLFYLDTDGAGKKIRRTCNYFM